MAEKTKRKSNIELLRIVAMFLIVSFHTSYKSGFVFDELDPNAFIIKVFWLFGELGVNLFMLVTGYFMCTGRFKFKRLILLAVEVLFYYLATYAIAVLAGFRVPPQGAADWFQQFFPVIMNRYWYVTAYILIYCLSPWINKGISSLNQREHLCFIGVMLVFWAVIPTLFGIFKNTTEEHLYYNRFIWFVVMYVVGAYIRLYPSKLLKSLKSSLALFAVTFALMCLAIVVISRFNGAFSRIGLTEWAYFWPPNTVLMFLCGIGLFGVFAKWDIPSSAFINKVSSTTLGIYLLHDGPLSPNIWRDVFGLAAYQSASWFPAALLGTAVVVFAIGVVVDLIRQLLEKVTVVKLLNSKAADAFGSRFEAIVSKVVGFFTGTDRSV